MALLWPMESLTVINQNANLCVMLVELAVNCSAERKLMCPDNDFQKFKVLLMTVLKVVILSLLPRDSHGYVVLFTSPVELPSLKNWTRAFLFLQYVIEKRSCFWPYLFIWAVFCNVGYVLLQCVTPSQTLPLCSLHICDFSGHLISTAVPCTSPLVVEL